MILRGQSHRYWGWLALALLVVGLGLFMAARVWGGGLPDRDPDAPIEGVSATGATPAADAPIVPVDDLALLADSIADQPEFIGGVLVARGDDVLFRQVYGPKDVRGSDPLTVTSGFRLASISKQFTAAAILKLQDDGVLNVEDPVCRWITPCPEAWVEMRIRHLISHTSGLPDLMQRPGWGEVRVRPTNLEELTRDSARYGLRYTPGERASYNNAGFNLAAHIVQIASGQSYESYLSDRFFKPLGMTSTGLGDDGNVVMGHARVGGRLIPQTVPNVSVVMGAGALYSTLDDMFKWERALHSGRVLSEAAYRDMIRNHAPPPPDDGRFRVPRAWGYGLFAGTPGLQVYPAFEDRQIYHTGSWSGFRNIMTYQPDQEITVIVLSNEYHQSRRVLLISQRAMAEVLGRPFPTGMRDLETGQPSGQQTGPSAE